MKATITYIFMVSMCLAGLLYVLRPTLIEIPPIIEPPPLVAAPGVRVPPAVKPKRPKRPKGKRPSPNCYWVIEGIWWECR